MGGNDLVRRAGNKAPKVIAPPTSASHYAAHEICT